MNALTPPKIRILAQRRMALATLATQSPTKHHNHHMALVLTFEMLGGVQ
jgi:hypothetical protein